jgi:AcrR family transcriptional regulator
MASSPRRSAGSGATPTDDARTRILETAYDLFSHHGIQAVGIDRIIAQAGVAKATLYHHFASKEALALAFLQLRERRWVHDWLQVEAEQRAADPQGRALAVFDALDQWFHGPDYEGCSFINTLLEVTDRASPVYQEAVRHLDMILNVLEAYAEDAGAEDPQEVGHQLQILAMGAIVSARRGDLEAARRARVLAESLLQAQPA